MSGAGLLGYAGAVRVVVVSDGFFGFIFYQPAAMPPGHPARVLAFFFGLLYGLPVLSAATAAQMRRKCDGRNCES